jgi:hypothetical protein
MPSTVEGFLRVTSQGFFQEVFIGGLFYLVIGALILTLHLRAFCIF